MAQRTVSAAGAIWQSIQMAAAISLSRSGLPVERTFLIYPHLSAARAELTTSARGGIAKRPPRDAYQYSSYKHEFIQIFHFTSPTITTPRPTP